MGKFDTDRHPPTHWMPYTAGEADIAFQHRDGRFRVEANRTNESADRPGLCLPGGWELTCHQRIGETTSVRSFGQVTTRRAAINALFACMNAINEVFERADPPQEGVLAMVMEDLEFTQSTQLDTTDQQFG